MISKTWLVLCFIVVAVNAAPGEKYTDKYDNINIQEIVENERLLRAYVDCMLDRGKCTPEGKELKEHVQDALETGCEKCTQAQQDKGTILFNHVIKDHIDIWKELTDKFDPTAKWRKKYEEEAKERGIIIPPY